jgi:hypothetical protein
MSRYAAENFVFAPTATDIMRASGGRMELSFEYDEFWCGEEKDFCPAEAAAAAWLERQKDKA